MTTRKTIMENMDDMLDIILDLTGVTPKPEITDKDAALAMCRAIYNLQDYIMGKDK